MSIVQAKQATQLKRSLIQSKQPNTQTKTKASKQLNARQEDQTLGGGHSSDNIVPLTKDQAYILNYMMKDESLLPILKLLFVNMDNISEFPKSGNATVKASGGGRRRNKRTRRNRKGRKQTRRRRT
jgi:hypothetical protein